MGKQKDLEKFLCPKVGKLIKKKDSVTATILDADLDPIILSFHYDDCVNINTDGLKYISLTYENLYDMICLLEKAEKHLTKKFNKDK